MKIISFDVGIKNMAYCVFTIETDSSEKKDLSLIEPCNIKIIDWNVIDLIASVGSRPEDVGETTNVPKICSGLLKNKKPCTSKAKYEKGEQCFCEKHAKMSDFMIPTNKCSPKYIKKLKVGELHKIIEEERIQDVVPSDKRPQLLEKIQKYYENKCLVLLVSKKKRADECSLITIGKKIKQSFDAISAMRDVTHVLIENQISTIASRMSIIQGLLTQYFIMRHNDDISDELILEFISSKNKLKMFSEKQIITKETTTSQKYRQHKTDSVIYSKQILKKYAQLDTWLPVLDTSKKDDLADCFLQGIWYIFRERDILS
jgi:hypothetical protein